MPVMSAIETAFCKSSIWTRFARERVTPWALQGRALEGDVLELGSGDGAMAEYILQRFPTVRLTASDLDDRMILAARERLAGRPNVSVRLADSTDLPFGDDSYDVVLTFLMLHHVIEWDLAMAEIERVLRPGGWLIGYDLTSTRLAKLVHMADRSPHRLVSVVELENDLQSRFADTQVRTSFGRHVMRFAAKGR